VPAWEVLGSITTSRSFTFNWVHVEDIPTYCAEPKSDTGHLDSQQLPSLPRRFFLTSMPMHDGDPIDFVRPVLHWGRPISACTESVDGREGRPLTGYVDVAHGPWRLVFWVLFVVPGLPGHLVHGRVNSLTGGREATSPLLNEPPALARSVSLAPSRLRPKWFVRQVLDSSLCRPVHSRFPYEMTMSCPGYGGGSLRELGVKQQG
jgi:hypothetical protein